MYIEVLVGSYNFPPPVGCPNQPKVGHIIGDRRVHQRGEKSRKETTFERVVIRSSGATPNSPILNVFVDRLASLMPNSPEHEMQTYRYEPKACLRLGSVEAHVCVELSKYA